MIFIIVPDALTYVYYYYYSYYYYYNKFYYYYYYYYSRVKVNHNHSFFEMEEAVDEDGPLETQGCYHEVEAHRAQTIPLQKHH